MWGPALVMREAQGIAVALLSPLIYAVIPGRDIPPLGSRVGVPRTRRTRARARVVSANRRAARARPGRRRIDQLRAQPRAAAAGALGQRGAGRLPLYLVASIPELDLNRHDLPPGVRYVGALLWHPPDPPGTAAWLDTLPADRPWVHVTEGTSHYQDPFLLRAAAAGLAGAPYEAILTTGRRRAGAISAQAPNVHVHDWLAHDALLPRCSALVTTGGAGTTMAGLRAGLPLVLVPTSWDKPDIALRMVEAGVAVRVAPRRCTPEALRAAVDEVLGDPRYRENARADRGEAGGCARAGRRGGPHRGAGERRAAGAGHCSAGGRR